MGYEQLSARIHQELSEVFEMLDRFFDLPSDLLTYKPEPDSWSIAEILEHITLTSHFLLLVIRKGRDLAIKRAQSRTVDQTETFDLEAINVISHPDSFAWMRPEHMEPTRSKSSVEVRQTMREQAQECLAILLQLSGGIGTLHEVRMSVQSLGKLNMYQWLYFLAEHARRHSVEIERIIQQKTVDPNASSN